VSLTSTLTANANSLMNVLTQASLSSASAQAGYRFQLVQQRLDAQFQQKIAALQTSNDSSAEQGFLKVEISQAAQQKSAFSTLGTQYGTNANVLADLTTQITALQTAAGAGDSAGFDNALGAANSDIANLVVVQDNPVFQPDGVTQLKTGGLGIQSSGAYDLSTAAGQSAALADLANASNQITQIFSATTSNQILAGSEVTALDSQLSSLNGTLENDQLNQTAEVTVKTLQLKQQLNTQVHLIELSLSNSQSAGASLQRQELQGQQALQPPAPGTIFSLFG
jgi:hypothetical protein